MVIFIPMTVLKSVIMFPNQWVKSNVKRDPSEKYVIYLFSEVHKWQAMTQQ